MLSCVQTSTGLSVFCNGTSYNVPREHIAYKKLVALVNEGKSDEFVKLVTERDVVQNMCNGATSGSVTYKNGVLFKNNTPLSDDGVHTMFVRRVENLIREGLNINGLLNFIGNYVENPSMNSRKQLLEFIERNELPVTEDGHFLAYKSLRSDYKDKHTGSVDNSPGAVNKMTRFNVDDNPNNHCSSGYHVGALAYSGPGGWFHSSGDKCVIVKVNPRDVVSVPADHNCQKCRVCEYLVLGDYGGKLVSPMYDKDGQVDINDFSGIEVSGLDSVYLNDQIRFVYEGKIRYGEVDYINYNNETVTCFLLNPEEHAGEIRQFKFDKMKNIKVVE